MLGSNVKNNYEVKDEPCLPCLWSETSNVLQVTDEDIGVLDTYNHARILKFGTHVVSSMSRKKFNVKDDPSHPCLWSTTLNIRQVTNDDRVVLDTLLILAECRILAHRSGI